MSCSRCAAENPDEAQFCGECGNSLLRLDGKNTTGSQEQGSASTASPTPMVLTAANNLLKVIMLPIWLPLMVIWVVFTALTVYRMYTHDDSFWGGKGRDKKGFWVGFVGWILLLYILPTIMIWALAGLLTRRFRKWIFGGIGT